jgi:hypothetical protein
MCKILWKFLVTVVSQTVFKTIFCTVFNDPIICNSTHASNIYHIKEDQVSRAWINEK